MSRRLELCIVCEGTGFIVKAKSDLGEREGFFELDPSVKSKIYDIQEAVEEQTSLDNEFVEEFGKKLFKMLFTNLKDLFHECVAHSGHVDVVLNMNDPELTKLPWELCYDSDHDILLGADPQCSFIRRDQETQEKFIKINYPLKILVIISSPMDLDEKGQYQPDPDEILDLMEPLRNLEDEGMVNIDFLERASVACIQDKLKEGYHIVHFIGHGYYDGETGKGYLIIEAKDRDEKKLEGRQVAQLFGINPPQLLILTACESSPLIPFLLPRRVPAVLAMQYTVLKDIAHEFVERFYSLLVRGDSLPEAVSNARTAVLLEEGIGNPGWFTPVLYMRSGNILNVNTESPVVIPEKKEMKRSDRTTDLLGVETFVGRRKDLWLVEKALFEENLKLVIITGIGGIGKTALASKFVKKHKNRFSGIFTERIIDPKMDVEEMLGLLNQFLVENGDDRLHEIIEEIDLDRKLERLNQCLKEGYLIVLDSFETLLENNKTANEEIEEFLKAILSGDHSSKIIITSRHGFVFRDEKMDSLFRNVDLRDLSFQFAGLLLEKLGVKNLEIQGTIYDKIGGNPQFLEFFVRLTRTRSIKKLLEDITPVREKMGEWLLDELVGLVAEKERNVLKKFSAFRLPVEKNAFGVLGANDNTIDKLVYYSLVEFEEYYFMHQGVREYLDVLMSDDERVTAHSEAVLYYKMLFSGEKYDLQNILELYYHLFESRQYEEAGSLVSNLFEPLHRWGFGKKLTKMLIQTVKTTEGQTKTNGLHCLAMVLQGLGEYEEAEKYYRESLKLRKSLGDKLGIAQSLHQLGMLRYLQGDYEEAEKYYMESLSLKKNLGDKQGISITLHQLGMLQRDQGNYEKSEEFFTESLGLAESLGDKLGIAATLGGLGNLQQLQGNYEEAEKYFVESLDILESFGDKQGISITLHQLGNLQRHQGNYEEAEKYYRKSLKLRKSLGDKLGIAQLLDELGNLQQYWGNYEEAEKYYRKSLDILENLGDKQGISITLHQLGNLKCLQRNCEEAEKYYRESLSLKKNLRDKLGIAQSLHQLGILRYLQGDYEEAEKYYMESLRLRKSLGDKLGIAQSLHQLGILWQYRGDYEEAEKHYRESLSLKKNLGDKLGIAGTLGQLGMLQEERKIFEEAIEYYIASLAIFSELGSPNADIAIEDLRRVKDIIGEELFKQYAKSILKEEVPDH